MIVGPHMTISKGFESAALEAVKIGANTFQYFTRNPRGGKAKALDLEDLKAYENIAKAHDFGQIMAHGAYTMNMCSKDPKVRAFALGLLRDDLERIQAIPNTLYVFHPGSHTGQGLDVGIAYIVDALNQVIFDETEAIICLETMSGKGSEVGADFESLKAIINGVRHKEKLGVCFDTCHLYSAGYDIVNDLEGVLDAFDQIVGLEYLKAIHLNDSMMAFASHKDRHEKIGQGSLGLEAIRRIVRHPKLRHLPFYLETPNDLEGYEGEISLLRSMQGTLE